MNVKTLKLLPTIFVPLFMTSCSSCEPQTIYIDKPIRVNVPVKCIVPDSNCSFDRNTTTEVISSLLECIIDMKKNEKVCK